MLRYHTTITPSVFDIDGVTLSLTVSRFGALPSACLPRFLTFAFLKLEGFMWIWYINPYKSLDFQKCIG